MKNFEKSSCERSQGVPKIFRAPLGASRDYLCDSTTLLSRLVFSRGVISISSVVFKSCVLVNPLSRPLLTNRCCNLLLQIHYNEMYYDEESEYS